MGGYACYAMFQTSLKASTEQQKRIHMEPSSLIYKDTQTQLHTSIRNIHKWGIQYSTSGKHSGWDILAIFSERNHMRSDTLSHSCSREEAGDMVFQWNFHITAKNALKETNHITLMVLNGLT